MTADLYLFSSYQKPDDLVKSCERFERNRQDRPETMEEWANRILTEAGVTPICENIPYGGSGIDGMGPKEPA